MALSMYQASIPVFLQALGGLSGVLDKAAAHAAAKKFDVAVLMGTRLFPDMFPLGRQIKATVDHAVGASARLASMEVPKQPDPDQNFEDAKTRIARALDFLKTFKPPQIDGTEAKEITLTLGSNTLKFTGLNYLLHFAVPNFFFHDTAAYTILRQAGVEIGKRDFMGQIPK